MAFFHKTIQSGWWKPAILFVLIGIAIGAGIGIAAFRSLDRQFLSAKGYAEGRLPVVNHELSAVGSDYSMTVGDSHAELLLFPGYQCANGRLNLPIIEGGVSGANIELVENFFERLQFAGRPQAIVVSVGTNDLFLKKKPLSPQKLGYFKERATALLDKVRQKADHTIVLAIPPMSEHTATILDVSAVEVYSDILKNLCQSADCTFIDPYATSRQAGRFGLAIEGQMAPDGLHMKSYQSSFDAIRDHLCGNAKTEMKQRG